MQKLQGTRGFIRGSSEPLSATTLLPSRDPGPPCISSFPIPRLSVEKTIYKIDIMKITKNIGMLLLAVYLIIDGLLFADENSTGPIRSPSVGETVAVEALRKVRSRPG